MNIALMPSAFHPHFGGVEELSRQLAHALRREGNRTLLLTNRWPKDLPDVEEFEGLLIRRYPFRVPERHWKQRGGALLFGPAAARHLCRDLAEFRPDILHVQCVSSNAYYALKAKRKLRLPLVVTLQGELTMDATGLFQRSRFAQDLMQQALREADAITACSAQTLQDAEAFWGKPFGARGRVIYNGIRLSEFENACPYPHPHPYIFGIGRFVRQKGFDLLLKAFAEIAQDKQIEHDLLLAGDGEERANLERLAAELQLGKRVHFMGRTDREQTIRLFCGCSFFVLPSRMEPLGIVNLEAMAAGKAVLASRVGGVPEIVRTEDTGLLVEGGSSEALAAGLRRLCRKDALREQMGRRGREQAARFDWDAVAGQYAEVYRQVSDRKEAA